MRNKAYPKYKSSGVEWLGDVPEHWEVKKGRLIGVLQSTPNVSEEEQSDEDGVIEYIKVEDLNTDGNMPLFRSARLKCIEYKKPFVKNALIFPKRGAAIFTNKVAILLHAGLLDPNMMGWQIDKKYNLKFYYYVLIFRRLDDLADTSTVPQINNKHIYPEYFPVPSRHEQQAIVAFLDRETGRIDALLAKKQQLLELLAEQRTALISRAVTKGLDASVELKPSGVEWLGDVPEHWKTKRIKYVAKVNGRIGFRGYTTDDLVDEGEGALVLGGTNLSKNGKVDLSKRTYLSWYKYHESPEIKVDIGDILFGQRGTCGFPVIIEHEIEPTTINPSLVIIKQSKQSPFFLCYWLMCDFMKSIVNNLVSSTAVPMLSQEQIGNFAVPLPPLSEQQVIAAFLERETTKIDELSIKVTTVIDRLKEYRTALISSAVTGKIDVLTSLNTSVREAV